MSENIDFGLDTSEWACVALAQGFELPRGLTLAQLKELDPLWTQFKRAHRKDRAIKALEAWIPGSYDLSEREDDTASSWGVDHIYLGRGIAYGRIGAYPSAITKKSLQKVARGFKEIPPAAVDLLGEQLGAPPVPVGTLSVRAMYGGARTIGQVLFGETIEADERDQARYEVHIVIDDEGDEGMAFVQGVLLGETSVSGGQLEIDTSDEAYAKLAAQVPELEGPCWYLLTRSP